MNTKQLTYLFLCIAGTLLPYSQFIPFLREHGLDLNQFSRQLFATRISTLFAFDVVVSSLVLWFFVYTEGTRLKMRYLWLYVVANLLVGVSLALPLFLFARELRLDTTGNRERSASLPT
jgi:hypothetical protein